MKHLMSQTAHQMNNQFKNKKALFQAHLDELKQKIRTDFDQEILTFKQGMLPPQPASNAASNAPAWPATMACKPKSCAA